MVDDELHDYVNEQLRPMGAFLSGRVTHELMAGFWPTADADPASPLQVRDFAAIWRDKPKYVCSRTALDLVETRAFGDGVVLLHHRHRPDAH
jgi:hypothetical protein